MRRLLAALPLLLALLGVSTPVEGTPLHPGCAGAASLHHAALIVEHGDGSVVRRCVGFDSATVTGEQLLDMSGVQWGFEDYGSMGKAVCQIDEEPATYGDPCLASGQPYWAMFVSRGGGGWTGSGRGVSSQTFADGDAEGFRFGMDAVAPVSAAGTCSAGVPTPPPSVTSAPPARQPLTGGHVQSSPAPAGTVAGASATAASGGTAQPASAAATPSGGVIGVTSAPLRAAPSGAPFGTGLVVAALLGGGLIGLLLLQVLAARRRTSP